MASDDELVFLRGRFPLAATLALPIGFDAVAVIPNSSECSLFLERPSAFMEFRSQGPPLVLMSGAQECVVLGLALPPPPVRNERR